MYIYSTISADVDYQTSAGTIRISGKANVANTKIITPSGIATKVTAEDFAALKGNHVFALHMENGFITVSEGKGDAEKVAADMTTRDKSAPDTENDMLLDSETTDVQGTTITKKKK